MAIVATVTRGWNGYRNKSSAGGGGGPLNAVLTTSGYMLGKVALREGREWGLVQILMTDCKST